MFDHACCLPPVRQTERLAICFLSVPPWVVIAGSAFSNRRRGYRGWLVHFGIVRFHVAIPTENEGDARDGERSRRRIGSALLRDRIGFAMFSAGSPLGRNVEAALRPRPQTCAKETRLPGLSSFDSQCGYVLRGEGRSGATETYGKAPRGGGAARYRRAASLDV